MIEYLLFNVNDSNETMKLKTENVNLMFDSLDKKQTNKEMHTNGWHYLIKLIYI